MYKVKAVALIAVLIIALTGAFLAFSGGDSSVPAQNIDELHSRLHDAMRDKLSSAEISLKLQGADLSSHTKLAKELSEVRDKLSIQTAEDLKKSAKDWNKPVFDILIKWKGERSAVASQGLRIQSEVLKSDDGSMVSQFVPENWWEKAPDLVLAFAEVPMKDGATSSILVAYGLKGKDLKGGKRYDEDAEMLASVSVHKQSQFGLFAWDGKMYLSAVEPVMYGETMVGTVVVGNELSKDILAMLKPSVPEGTELVLVYSSPKFGDAAADKSVRRFFSTSGDEIQKRMETGQFKVMTGNNANGTIELRYDKIQPNLLHVNGSDGLVALSRIRWVWNPVMRNGSVSSEETDLYFVSDLSLKKKDNSGNVMGILITSLIAIIVGIVLAILLVNGMQKDTKRIRKAFANAISTKDPIDVNALAILTGESADGMPQYIIRLAEEDAEDDWGGMIDMTEDDADTAQPEESKSAIEADKDDEETKILYNEYMKLRKENNINEPMEYDVFARRLQRNADKIKRTYHCEHVSFKVQVEDGKVNLKPQIDKG